MLTVEGVEAVGRLHQTVNNGVERVVGLDAAVEGRRVEAWIWGATKRVGGGGGLLRGVSGI